MPNKKMPTNRYNPSRSRQQKQANQQRPRPAPPTPSPAQQTPATPVDSDIPIATTTPVVEMTATPAPAPAYRSSGRQAAPSTRRASPSPRFGGRSTISGLTTNWVVVRHDLRRIGIITLVMLLVLLALTFILPALHII